jgi:hypothetical protein
MIAVVEVGQTSLSGVSLCSCHGPRWKNENTTAINASKQKNCSFILFTHFATEIAIERTKAPRSAPIASKPIINVAKKFFRGSDRSGQLAGGGSRTPPPVGDPSGTFLALWLCFPRQRLTIDPHYEANAVPLRQMPDASRRVSMRPTRRHGMLMLLNCIGLSQIVGYPAE